MSGQGVEGFGFDDFRRMAADPGLSLHEKVGFPDSYRDGHERAIHDDIVRKVPALARAGSIVVEIGAGCAGLPRLRTEDALRLGQHLYLVDSGEMLALLPDTPGVAKVPGAWPQCPELRDELAQRADAVIAYSVLQCVFAEADIWKFIDAGLALLAPGGHFLIGDIPNVSMRRRLFESETGKAFHREFTGRQDDPPEVPPGAVSGQIDDAVVFGILQRVRAAGMHGYVLPQAAGLPMHNRREDLLIVRP